MFNLYLYVWIVHWKTWWLKGLLTFLFVAFVNPCLSLDMSTRWYNNVHPNSVYIVKHLPSHLPPIILITYFATAIFWRGYYSDLWRAVFSGIASILSLAFSKALRGGCLLCIVNKTSADYAIKLFCGLRSSDMGRAHWILRHCWWHFISLMANNEEIS